MKPKSIMLDTAAPLTREELQSLLAVAKGAMQPIIPLEHKRRLSEIGYVKEVLGGLVLTAAGLLRAAEGR
jgi:hypothetical protein